MGHQTVRFFDSEPVADASGVRRVVHAADKHPANPVVTPTEPWETGPDSDSGGNVYLMGTVQYDEEAGRYRMWYRTANPDLERRGYGSKYLNLYAESDDGIEWRKPDLGVFEWEGSTDNNVLGTPPPKLPTVFEDPDAPPEGAYKLFSYYHDGDVSQNVVMHSADGIRWTESDASPVHDRDRFPNLEDASSGFYDPHHDLYVGTGQLGSPGGRRVYTTTSEDFREWTDPTVALAEDDRDRDLVENRGGDRADYYYLSGYAYEELWLGFAHVYEVGVSEDLDNGSGPIAPRLAISRDRGDTWEKTWHEAAGAGEVIPRGDPGEFDSGMVFTANQPIVRDDEMVLYYGGMDGGHEADDRMGAIGIATWPLDRFVSYRSVGDVGTVTTVPTAVTGERLVVNADPTIGGSDGSLRVELLDRSGVPLRGYERADCRPVEADSLRNEVRWEDGRTLEPLRDRELRFRFYLDHADLYTMSFR